MQRAPRHNLASFKIKTEFGSSKKFANGLIVGMGMILLAGIAVAATSDDDAANIASAASATYSPPKMPTPTLATVKKIQLPDEPKVVLLGDSFGMGHGAEPRSKGYAYLLGEHMGWNHMVVDGVGKTGYTDGGENRYVERLRKRAATAEPAPDLVIMQGAVNDTWVDYEDMHQAVTDVVETINGAWPDAEVVLTAPITYRAFYDEERALRNVAEEHDLIYLTDQVPSAWLPQYTNLYHEDTWHPSTEGHARIAKLMAEALQARVS